MQAAALSQQQQQQQHQHQQQARGSYYDNHPRPDSDEVHENDMSFCSTSSDESDEEEETDNHVVTGRNALISSSLRGSS